MAPQRMSACSTSWLTSRREVNWLRHSRRADLKMSASNITSMLCVNVVAQVEKMIREKLGGLMYNNGKGELITRTEFLRWKYRNNEKVTFV